MRSGYRYRIMKDPAIEVTSLDTNEPMHGYVHLQTSAFGQNPRRSRLKHLFVTIHIDRAITRNPHLLQNAILMLNGLRL
jgi:hypothetical protein